MRGAVDLSSGFGDYRPSRFHAGVDIRTGGQIGRKVYSPVDGYVWRIKMAYSGYGKGLYVQGRDGRIYVYGHLDGFSETIEKAVRKAQFAAERYYVDLTFEPAELPVTKGQLIAFSGETGIGAPHLHFEVRSADNRPLNPLRFGYELADHARPVFERIAFQMTDGCSLLDNGRRSVSLPVVHGKTAGEYLFDTVLAFTAPFGLLTQCYDQMRGGGMRQAVYSLRLVIDDGLYYESVFDSTDFDWGPSANLEYDYESAVSGEKRIRRLFHRPGNRYVGSSAANGHEGIFGLSLATQYGLHSGVITATDVAGNKAKLGFRFLWLPEAGFYDYDTLVVNGDGTRDFFFAPTAAVGVVDVDSVRVEDLQPRRQGPVRQAIVTTLDDNWLKVRLDSVNCAGILRLRVFPAAGGSYAGQPFTAAMPSEVSASRLAVSVIDNGLLLPAPVPGGHTGSSVVELPPAGTTERIDARGYVTDGVRHYVFFRPATSTGIITAVALQLPSIEAPTVTLSAPITAAVLGVNSSETWSLDDAVLTVSGGRDCFYEPTVVMAERRVADPTSAPGTAVWEITPRAFVTAKPLALRWRVADCHPKAGLGWRETERSDWTWLSSGKPADGVLSGSTQGGGQFGVVIDTVPPSVRNLNVREGATLTTNQPGVRFELSDRLSGIQDDRNIEVRVDGVWFLPEYDTDKHTVKAKGRAPLAAGPHTLKIVATDRAGNRTELVRRFVVE